MPRHIRAIAVQPQWFIYNFFTAAAFRRWMRLQLDAARPHLHPTWPNLVVLTELNGLPLVLRGAHLTALARTFEQAAAIMFLLHLPAALPILWREKVSPIRALQLARAQANTTLYLRVCQQLAREYGVYLVCGSAPTPHFWYEGQQLRRSSELYNQTHIFSPSGALLGSADKVHLTPDEQRGGVDLSAGRLSDLRVFPTPAGDLGVAISLDAFRPDVTACLQAQGCTVLLQPDANGSPWSAPEGLPPDPAHQRDQPQAWLDSSWAVTHTGRVRYAVNPMVVGNLFNLSFDGQSAITGPAAEAATPQSYAMTAPRPGFLALMPWLSDNNAQLHEQQLHEHRLDEHHLHELRQLGRQRAAHSGHPQENRYLTGAISADLHLPDSELAAPAPTPHEQALEGLLAGKADTALRRDTLRPLWLPLGLLATTVAITALIRRYRR